MEFSNLEIVITSAIAIFKVVVLITQFRAKTKSSDYSAGVYVEDRSFNATINFDMMRETK